MSADDDLDLATLQAKRRMLVHQAQSAPRSSRDDRRVDDNAVDDDDDDGGHVPRGRTIANSITAPAGKKNKKIKKIFFFSIFFFLF
jgi:hypothetical protein